jgi:NAD+ synthase (glutamine-hydrolysing)
LATHLYLALDGIEIIGNASGSYHQLRKANNRTNLVRSATAKCGGIYLMSNQRGCDGDRLYFDGCASIAINGQFVKQGQQFAMKEVEVLTAVLDIDDVISYRNRIRSFQFQAADSKRYPRINVNFNLCIDSDTVMICSLPREWIYHDPMEEIALGPACWLWDYLRRSKQGGFFLPLSGGIDSCSTACIVFSMCTLLCKEIEENNESVINEVKRIVNDTNYTPKSAQDLCSKLLVTCYMATVNNSQETYQLAKTLGSQIGSTHLSIVIDVAVDAILSIWRTTMNVMPRFRSNGGSNLESTSLQNIQARLRMVLAYLFAQLSLWAVGRPGSLLVLGSANVDESLRGYFTKYDCSRYFY